MRSKLILLSTMITITLCLFACTCTLEQISSIDISFDDFQVTHYITKNIETSVGDTFTISLFSNRTTGFQWPDLATIANQNIIKQINHVYEPPESDVPGAPGKEVFTFEALREGKTTISMEYSQPWEGGIKAEWTFGLDVFVR